MLKFNTATSALITTLMLCMALPAQAQWKWKDTAGKIQYSDLPPPNGTPEKDILQRPPGQKLQVFVLPPGGATSAAPSGPARAASAAPSKAEREQQAKQKQQEQEQAAKQREEDRRIAQQKRENCSRAQENLRMLEAGVRLTRQNERGENIFIDERQRAEELQRTRVVAASECK